MHYVYRAGLTDGRNSYDRGRNTGKRFGKPHTNNTSGAGAGSAAGGGSRRPGHAASSSAQRAPAGRPSRFGARPQANRRSSFGQGGRRPSARRSFGQHIDVSRFVKKAVITERVEHFVPEHKFADFDVSPELKKNIVAKGYVDPTPIQDKAIPHVLRGSDVVGIANTGTGKTAAFLIPLIDKVLKDRTQNVLIVVPTRELAIQIEEEFVAFAKGLKLFSACLVGGASMGKQVGQLRLRNNFVIGTPGRIKDHIQRKNLSLASFRTVVLDEADRMLDMGFIADMRYFMALMPKERHTLFFSATLSPEIGALIKDFLREPVTISVKTGDTAKNVDQDVIKTAGRDKVDVLHELLSQPDMSKVLIFGRTKHGVEKLARLLSKRGFKAESIHGNKSQSQRQRALGAFKDNKAQVLIATDVAARGLDISEVSHVINFDIPATYEDYVHRIGRTGRAGNTGKALTFIEE